jgi:hypothetical protein
MSYIFDEKVNEKLNASECLNKVCSYNEGNFYIDCKYFKYLLKNKIHVQIITKHMEDIFSNAFRDSSKYSVHICLKGVTISDCDKHRIFARDLSCKLYYLCENDPDNALQNLYIYNPSSIISALHRIFDMFCHADTKKKIIMVK